MIYDAVYKDIKRCTFDGKKHMGLNKLIFWITMGSFYVVTAAISDILGVKVEIANMLRNMNRYLKPREFSRNLLAITDKSKIRLEPRGVVLIIGTWNYPFYISLRPLVGAIAAGNCALVKPSEIACHSAQVMAQIIPKYLDNVRGICFISIAAVADVKISYSVGLSIGLLSHSTWRCGADKGPSEASI